LLKSGSSVAAANIIQSLLGIVMLAFLAQVLSMENLGKFLLIISLYSAGRFTILPGMTSVLMKGVVKNNEGIIYPALKRSMISAVVASAAFIVVGFSFQYFDVYPSISYSLIIASLMLPIASLEKFDVILRGRKNFNQSVSIILFGAILRMVLVAGAAELTRSVEWTILAYGVSNLLKCIVGWHFVNKWSGDKGNEVFTSSLIKQGWEQTGFLTLNSVVLQLDKIILGLIDPVSLAVYHIGAQIPNAIKGNVKALLSVPLVHWSSLSKKENIRELVKYGYVIILFGLCITFLVVVIVPFLIPLMFGEQYKASIYIAIALSLTIGIKSLAVCYWSINLYQENGRSYGANVLISKTFYVLLLLALTPVYGIWGAVISVLSLDVFLFISSLRFFIKKKLDSNSNVNNDKIK